MRAIVWLMAIERCDECGFDGAEWTDDAATAAIADLPSRWRRATEGLADNEAGRRPMPDTWSIVEYVDHVREVLFGMRFLLDSAASDPGANLGASPEPHFHPQPRELDLPRALGGVEREARSLADHLAGLSRESWSHSVIVDGEALDAGWVCRHAVHDATHHLMDVTRIRAALSDAS